MNHFSCLRRCCSLSEKASKRKLFMLRRKVKFHQEKYFFYRLYRLLNKHYKACRHFYALLHLVLSTQKKKNFALFIIIWGFSQFPSFVLCWGNFVYCSVYIEQDLQPNYDSLSFFRLWHWIFPFCFASTKLLSVFSHLKPRKEFNNASFFRLDFISFVDLRFNFSFSSIHLHPQHRPT